MIKLTVYKITSGGQDYYYLSEEEAKATGHTVTTVETHKGSLEALATKEVKPEINLEEEVEREEHQVTDGEAIPEEEELMEGEGE